MSKEVIGAWDVENAEELQACLTAALEYAAGQGHHPSTVYPNKLRMTLVSESLSDGSKVMNLYLFDGDRPRADVMLKLFSL
jgi:hypothetical protein